MRLEDCPPSLQQAIMRQLAKEQSTKPTISYLMATRIGNHWTIGPQSPNRALVAKLVQRHCLQNGMTSYQTIIGKPPAVLIEIATPPGKQGEPNENSL